MWFFTWESLDSSSPSAGIMRVNNTVCISNYSFIVAGCIWCRMGKCVLSQQDIPMTSACTFWKNSLSFDCPLSSTGNCPKVMQVLYASSYKLRGQIERQAMWCIYRCCGRYLLVVMIASPLQSIGRQSTPTLAFALEVKDLDVVFGGCSWFLYTRKKQRGATLPLSWLRVWGYWHDAGVQ